MKVLSFILRIKKNKSGFTLVEMAIVAILFAIIGVGLVGTLSSGLKIWSRAKDTGTLSPQLAFSLELVARDLRQSVYMPQIGFTGGAKQLSFLAFSRDSVFKITYKFDDMQNVLLRRQEGLKTAIDEDLQGEYTEEKFADLDDAQFRYLYFDKDKEDYAWKDTWAKEDGLPPAVRIKIKLGNEECEKTVFIPTA
jgi:prepilin-type N-terminal cleavage/methylation domain-containing protein